MFATEFPCPLPNGAPGSALASIVGMQEKQAVALTLAA